MYINHFSLSNCIFTIFNFCLLLKFCSANKQTNKQTNALLSIKMPTMSSIINTKSQYTIDSHNNFFHWIGQYKQNNNKKKKNHLVRNIVIMYMMARSSYIQ